MRNLSTLVPENRRAAGGAPRSPLGRQKTVLSLLTVKAPGAFNNPRYQCYFSVRLNQHLCLHKVTLFDRLRWGLAGGGISPATEQGTAQGGRHIPFRFL